MSGKAERGTLNYSVPNRISHQQIRRFIIDITEVSDSNE